METSIIIGLFLLGTIFGSFYNVVAYRVTKGESILFPASHCPHCGHKLKPWELIPILSFLLQKGKCSDCKARISLFYPIAEAVCGLLFVLAYLSFGLSLDLIIALTFISMLIIIILSDCYYMVIEDSVLLIFGIALLIEVFFIKGLDVLFISLRNGFISFGIMLLIKVVGDFIFKKESMGGGDIKLMLIFGFLIGWDMSIVTIFLSAFLAFPVSLIILKNSQNHEIPYGPFLSIAALIIYLTHFDINMLISFMTRF